MTVLLVSAVNKQANNKQQQQNQAIFWASSMEWETSCYKGRMGNQEELMGKKMGGQSRAGKIG